MSCSGEGLAIVMTMEHDQHTVVVEHCRDLTTGMVGLLVAEFAARFCADNPATKADRISIERSRLDRS